VISRGGYFTDPFTDLLFNMLLGFTLLLFLTIALSEEVVRRGMVDPKAEFLITATWPELRRDDVDLWVQDPTGRTVSYLRREAGLMHLDRDDRGDITDTIEIEGRRIVHPINQEIVSLRGVAAGEYVVNLYLYHSSGEGAVPVTVKLERVNPRFETVLVEQVELAAQDEEITVARFTVGNDRELSRVNRLTKRLTPYAL
jgi:hypothetical protein